MLLSYLEKIPDHRRAQGKMFDLPHVLLFSILAIAGGANSYRTMAIFIREHFETLKKEFGLNWKRPPNYNSFRHVIHSVDTKELETAFRAYSKALHTLSDTEHTISLDGKALKHSFNTIEDNHFAQILSVFSMPDKLILAHDDVGTDKDNEIAVAIRVLKELDIPHALYTLDALHTQKKRCKL